MGDKIRTLRLSLGLTLEDVGKAVGVGKSTVRKWESGDIKNMRRDKIASLAAILQTTPAYLMGWDLMDPVPPEESTRGMNDNERLAFYRGLTLGEREKPTKVSDDEPVDPLDVQLTNLLRHATPEQKKAWIALLESMQPEK